MNSYKFWLVFSIIVQALTGFVHTIALFMGLQGSTEEEQRVIGLMKTLKMDAGAGFHPTLNSLFIAVSSCFTLLYLFGGMLNFYLWRMRPELKLLKGFISLQLLIFGAAFLCQAWYAFLPPIILTGLVFVSLLLCRLTFPKTTR